MKEARKRDCAANFAQMKILHVNQWGLQQIFTRTKENFTRKPMGIAAKFYYARSWLILPGMVKNHDWQLNNQMTGFFR